MIFKINIIFYVHNINKTKFCLFVLNFIKLKIYKKNMYYFKCYVLHELVIFKIKFLNCYFVLNFILKYQF